MRVLFITEVEQGWELSSGDGGSEGIAETLAEAVESARQHVEMGNYSEWCINE